MVAALIGLKGDRMRIATIYRYPVKTLTAERLPHTSLQRNQAIPGDRRFAFAHADCGFDPAAPSWRSKRELLCLARTPDAISLRAQYDDSTDLLTLIAADGGMITASPLSPDGAASLAAFAATALPGAKLSALRLISAESISFTDQPEPLISLIGLPSLHALEAATGAPRDPLRFRANLYLENLAPWAEFDWIGQRLTIGEAVLEITERIDRCAATGLNPATGARDANPVHELLTHFGHSDCGVFARVIAAGRIAPGDAVRLQP